MKKLLLILAMFTAIMAQAQLTLYVDSSRATSGAGTSWSTAYRTLGEALATAWQIPSVTAINVAQGTYYPAYYPYAMTSVSTGVQIVTGNVSDQTFHIRTGLSVLGGYPTGGGTRSPIAYPTILSGGSTNYHVVLMDSSGKWHTPANTTIDGFTITLGNAGGTDSLYVNGTWDLKYNGSGIYISSGTNTISNNTISNNFAKYGAGIFLSKSNNNIRNNTVKNNNAWRDGGGIFCVQSQNSIINNVVSGNTGHSGAGIILDMDNDTLANNTFFGNMAQLCSGGLLVTNVIATISNNIFWGNTDICNGPDFLYDTLLGPSTLSFHNNILQQSASHYASGTLSYIGPSASGNLFAQDPLFVNAASPSGADGIDRTADDGLRVTSFSPALFAGITGAGIPATDILGAGRGSSVTIGAYQQPLCLPIVTHISATICQGATYTVGTYIFTTTGIDTVTMTGAAVSGCDSMVILDLTVTPTTLYVDSSVSASGDGSSWAAAYQTLDEALATAWQTACITTINVAQGTYYPLHYPYEMAPGGTGTVIRSNDTADRTFHIRTGLTMLGGYPSGGGTRSATAHPTILSGAGTCYHVVVIDSSYNWMRNGLTTVDGFYITGGAANSPSGLTVFNAHPLFQYYGGGIYLVNGTNIINNNTIWGNNATSLSGGAGGIYVNYGRNTISNNSILLNYGTDGGGIFVSQGINKITDNAIAVNSGGRGAGMYLYDGNNTISSSTIYFNNGYSGGGAFVFGGSHTFNDNIFWKNVAHTAGPDYINMLTGTATVSFNNNMLQLPATQYAVGTNFYIGSASGNLFAQDPQIADTNNIAGADGIYRTADDGLRVTSSSPALFAGITGAGIPASDILGVSRGSSVTIGAYQQPLCLPIVTRLSAALCPGASYTVGTHTYSSAGIDTVTFANGAASGCDSTVILTLTIGGLTLYVDSSAAPGGNGHSWATAYQSLGDALDTAWQTSCVTTIYVAQGTYYPSYYPYNMTPAAVGSAIVTGDPRDQAFHIRTGLTVLGGFPSGGGTRAATAHPTILSGNRYNYHVVLMDSSSYWTAPGITTLDGFTITGGYADGFNSIFCNLNNVLQYYGAGVFISNGTNIVTHNNILRDTITVGGAGMYILGGHNTIVDNSFAENATIYGHGAGLYINDGSNGISDNTFSANNANTYGGALYIYGGSNSINSNTLMGNSAKYGGGAYVVSGTDIFNDNIFWLNSAVTAGPDYYYDISGAATLGFHNNMLQLASSHYTSGSAYGLGTSSANIFGQDPLFVNAASVAGADGIYRTSDDGLRVNIASPASATGISGAGIPVTDILGASRGSVPTIGAYQAAGIVSRTDIYANIDSGSSYSVGPYSHNATGVYTDILVNASVNGQDSIVTLHLNVIGHCTVAVAVNAGTITPCSGSVTFTATTINTSGTVTYVWHKNNVSVGSGTTYTTSALGYGDSIWVNIGSASACGGPNNKTAISNKIYITGSGPVPTLAISANHTNLDLSGAVVLSATSTNSGANPIYSWYHNGSPVVNGRGYATLTYSGPLGNADQIYCILTANTCGSTAQTATSNTLNFTKSGSNAKDITAFTMPGQIGSSVINTTAATVIGTIAAGSRTSMHPTYMSVSPFCTYGPSYITNQNFTGPVTYTLRAQNGSVKIWTVAYTDPSGHRTMSTTGIDNATATPVSLSVYPDPASSYVMLSATGGIEIPVVTIVDMMGRVMYHQALPATVQINHMVDLTEFATGSYIVYLSVGERKQTSQFVVKK